MTIVPHREWDFDHPLVLVGFPSRGLVGAITASYLVPHLDMKLVATMDSPLLPPVASVRDGKAMAPVQFFASTVACGIQGQCSQLIVIRSDATPDPEHTDAIASELLAWAHEVGAQMVVSVEGGTLPTESPAVYGVPNLFTDADMESIGATRFDEGSLGGLSASLLVQSNSRGKSALCLFTGVTEGMPDAMAAARLIEVVDNLVPGIKVDASPLEEKARGLEASLQRSRDQQDRSLGRPTASETMMYG